MKTIRIHAYGHSDHIRMEDAPRPSAKPGEVLVKIHAAGVNPVDWKIREGFYEKIAPREFPFTLGQDFSGEVVELGDGAQGFKVGDEVYGFVNGSYAEYAAASVDKIARKPRTIDFNTAAGLPTPALTAYQIVTKLVQPSKGQTILIHGAAGGVGTLATQLCIWKQARVIATAASSDVSYLKDLGVEQVIDYKVERFDEKMKEVDAVIDLVGGETLSRSLPLIKNGGVLVSTVGPIDTAEAAKRNIRAFQILMEKNAADLAEIAKLVDQGVLKPRLDQVMPLIQAKDAQDLYQSGHTHGKLILKVA